MSTLCESSGLRWSCCMSLTRTCVMSCPGCRSATPASISSRHSALTSVCTPSISTSIIAPLAEAGLPQHALYSTRHARSFLPKEQAGTVLICGREGAPPNNGSLQACSFYLRGRADWSPTANLLTPHPAHAGTCALPNDEHRLYKWSFQASLLHSRNGTHVVPTAPVEGAPPAICKSELVPRARSGSTGTICVSFPPFWCARSASKGDQQPSSTLIFSLLP